MKLWLDTDPGVDDALAMAFIAAQADLEWVGVSTVFGNASVDQTTTNALALLAALGRHDVPVHAGAAAPLIGHARYAPEVHGTDGLGGQSLHLPQSRAQAQPQSGPDAMLAASRAHADLHVVAVGPFTNLALALRADPAFATRVASLTLMGGALGQNGQSGNVTPAAEANVHNDARAAAEVLAAPWRSLRLIGLDATHCVRLTPDAVQQLPRWLHALVAPYMQFYGEYYGHPMLVAHDAIAVAALLRPDAFTWRRGALRVVEGGWAHGQTVQDWQQLGDAAWRDLPAHDAAIGAAPDPISSLCLSAWLRTPEISA